MQQINSYRRLFASFPVIFSVNLFPLFRFVAVTREVRELRLRARGVERGTFVPLSFRREFGAHS